LNANKNPISSSGNGVLIWYIFSCYDLTPNNPQNITDAVAAVAVAALLDAAVTLYAETAGDDASGDAGAVVVVAGAAVFAPVKTPIYSPRC
jgi:chromate transport protein ChrA